MIGMSESYRLLVGSLGDDSHSVGMRLIAIAFREAGFFVKELGILNALDDFLAGAGDFDAVFISCMNGHVDMYLQDFPARFHAFRLGDRRPRVWFLGGNLSVKDSDETVVRTYLRMGFDFVAPKPVSLETIRQNLLKHFEKKGMKKRHVGDQHADEGPGRYAVDGVDDEPLSDERFLALRREVLGAWPTGEQVVTADIRGNHADPSKNFHNAIVRNQEESTRPLVQPRTGVAHTADEIGILRYLRGHGLDMSSIQLDAASRKKMFAKAAEGVERSDIGRNSFLNGYPIPVHGVRGVEEILKAIDTPFQIRAGSPDHRFVYEIGLAGGTTSLEGGFICYLFPYDKHTSPIECLEYWKYVDKLTEWYHRQYGVIINREYFGPLTCGLIEPCIPIAINIVQAVLSAKSGVRCVSVGLAEQGNRAQDIAAIGVLGDMTRRYLQKYGFPGCRVSTVYHQYMAAFPTELGKARDLIFNSSITGALAKADRFMTKTPVESIHIPAKEDNAEGLALTYDGVKAAKDVPVDSGRVLREKRLLEREVHAMMHAIEILGGGSLARGAIRAFQEGMLDVPFSPSRYNRNLLMTVKDCDGAIRFVNPERLPFPEEVKDFHRERISYRMAMERTSRIHELLERDLTRIWRNDFKSWPLDGNYVT